MPSNLTQMSAAEYDKILYGNMTPSMAAAYLQERDIPLRNFPQVLQSMYPGADLLPRLVEYLSRIGPEEGGASVQSLGKKAHNWLSGRNVPANREDYFRIAFALGLGESQLNTLLGLFTDYGIQYRDGRELVFAWFLRHGYGYLDALRFYGALPSAPGMERLEPGRNSQLTHELHNRFQLIQTTEELRHCYLENLEYFGSLHLRAYYYFQGYLDQLIHPVPSWDAGKEPDYSIETVMNTYLSMQVPSGAKRSHYSLIQKLIRQNWPNTTALNNIRNHKLDVPRKLLLLLYVVTENTGDTGDPYRELDESYITLEERLEDHWWTLNAMLSDCGMAPLDLRNPFDWLILYAICADESEYMSDRMEQVLAHLFPENKAL